MKRGQGNLAKCSSRNTDALPPGASLGSSPTLAPKKRKPGRPPGAKNKQKEVEHFELEEPVLNGIEAANQILQEFNAEEKAREIPESDLNLPALSPSTNDGERYDVRETLLK